MQRLIVQVATTFFGDAIALVNGFGRIVTHFLMAPVERMASACDVAGILEQRAARAAGRPVKVALTAEQVERLKLPPQMTAKKGSSRRAGFVEKHGEAVFELEAIHPG